MHIAYDKHMGEVSNLAVKVSNEISCKIIYLLWTLLTTSLVHMH